MSAIKDNVLTKISAVCQLMGDGNRMRILFMCAQEPTAVKTFVEILNLSQPLISHHLRLLKEQRLIKGERQGKQIFYSLYDDHVHCILKDMYQHWAEENH
ncbi:ArsR/SmtB family transcription factor [Fastidiosibacter lacustris]|uniref:ArsR/SmtB family transcription factor n=1 Tax=Fastidiosibacter lacustris TaxID=2056695 RepID=UPI000E35604D|nr:metalloregulator ArsR/SmtB family transcription factor [Fastidiosibacter lacustris]